MGKLKVLAETQYITAMLMQLDNRIWDKLGAKDGGDLPPKWKEYVQMVKQLVGNKKVSMQVYKELENENHHSLLKALEELGLVEK